MKAAVYDTYVYKKEGSLMHFDIVVPENTAEEKVLSFGKEWLQSKGEEIVELSTKECRFCHIEKATPGMISDFDSKGFYIIEMEGC